MAQSDVRIYEKTGLTVLVKKSKDAPVLRWYVLKAISGKEASVKEYIELDMKNHGYEDRVSQVLIPQENIIKVGANNKRIPTKRNLLPGYVLVEAALDGEITHMLRNTPNVLGFLGGTDKPSPVRQVEVNRMLGLGSETEDDVVETVVNVNFLVGESVKVKLRHLSLYKFLIFHSHNSIQMVLCLELKRNPLNQN